MCVCVCVCVCVYVCVCVCVHAHVRVCIIYGTFDTHLDKPTGWSALSVPLHFSE